MPSAIETVVNILTSQGQSSFGGTVGVQNTTTSYGSALSGLWVSSPEGVNWEYLQYYIVTLDRNSPTVNYTTLKNNNVAGVIIEAGYLYTASHMTQYYRNPKLNEQCISASQADMPFGLYCTSKARSIDEAKDELYQLSFCIRKYPPMIGMWVDFQLVRSKSVNDSIVDYYKDYLIKLGLKGDIGIIATPDQLNNISWSDKHCEDWSLWLVDHVDSTSEIEGLLTPDMFVVD